MIQWFQNSAVLLTSDINVFSTWLANLNLHQGFAEAGDVTIRRNYSQKAGNMSTISHYLGNDHHRCDEMFILAEVGVSNNNWEQAETCLEQFAEALEQHFAMEEKVMFPEFEKAVNSNAGPTAVMRMEHEQLRAIVALLQEALKVRDSEAYLGHSETLNTMMQQHNMKEESVLYVMADRVLSGRQDEIINAMTAIDTTA